MLLWEPKYTFIYILTIVLVFGIVGVLLNKFMKGESTDLLIDLPPLRMPKFSNIMKKTYLKSKMFIIEAGPLFVLEPVIITVLQDTGALDATIDLCAPITQGFLKLDPRVTQTFIMGIIRRDFGACWTYRFSISRSFKCTSTFSIFSSYNFIRSLYSGYYGYI